MKRMIAHHQRSGRKTAREEYLTDHEARHRSHSLWSNYHCMCHHNGEPYLVQQACAQSERKDHVPIARAILQVRNLNTMSWMLVSAVLGSLGCASAYSQTSRGSTTLVLCVLFVAAVNAATSASSASEACWDCTKATSTCLSEVGTATNQRPSAHQHNAGKTGNYPKSIRPSA